MIDIAEGRRLLAAAIESHPSTMSSPTDPDVQLTLWLLNNAPALLSELEAARRDVATLREMVLLVTSVHTMSDEQLAELVANARAARDAAMSVTPGK